MFDRMFVVIVVAPRPALKVTVSVNTPHTFDLTSHETSVALIPFIHILLISNFAPTCRHAWSPAIRVVACVL